MCWSMEVSILTGAACYVASAYLIYRNVRWDRANGIFLLAVSSMQFADAVLWWDGMEGCSTTNWITSVIFIPLILRIQWMLRHMEMRFKAVPEALLWLALAIAVGLAVVPSSSTFSPVQSFLYHTNLVCSWPSTIDVGSPLWGGMTPVFSVIIYLCVALPPVAKTGRYVECVSIVAILSVALLFYDAWASKWCSFACLKSILYLAWSGPPLPAHARAHLKEAKPTSGPALKMMHAYERFCFGSAKVE